MSTNNSRGRSWHQSFSGLPKYSKNFCFKLVLLKYHTNFKCKSNPFPPFKKKSNHMSSPLLKTLHPSYIIIKPRRVTLALCQLSIMQKLILFSNSGYGLVQWAVCQEQKGICHFQHNAFNIEMFSQLLSY